MIKPSYLDDKEFLKKFDLENKKEQYIRISVLDFQTENLIANIEGKSTGGSCNLNGASNMRRTANCTIAIDPDDKICDQTYYNITDIDNLISMNKKIRIDTGFFNTLADLGYYTDYDIIWFPLGTYVIKTASVSKNNSGINISLTLNDKTSLLNGDMGGIIPASTVFSEEDVYDATKTVKTTKKILIKDIIRNLVVEFGGESSDNVIITDIDDYIVKVLKWSNSKNKTIYLYEDGGNATLSYEKQGGATAYQYGQDIGYSTSPFVYPGTLECNAGESVASVLDKIKNTLGNFEWFYDINGRFVFQKQKNYLTESPTKKLLELTEDDYLPKEVNSVAEYRFDKDNKTLLTSISSAPQFQNIKNDFIVWGTTKTAAGVDKPIRYHLTFDSKPPISTKSRLMLIYNDYTGRQCALSLKAGVNLLDKFPTKLTEEDKAKVIYNDSKVYLYDPELECFREYPDYKICNVKPDEADWRTELYYRGLEADDQSFSKNPYFAELNAEWTKLCDLIGRYEPTEKVYYSQMRDIPVSSYEYWLDFVEDSPFNINNIGRRTKIVSDNATNCVFPQEVPEYIYILADGDAERIENERQQAKDLRREYIQVNEDVFNYLTIGGSKSSAFDKIKELIYTHMTYNETVNLSIIPIYHLEPNTRISIFDRETGVNGDYMIKSISLPLTPTGTSNIAATKCLDKTF